MKERPITFTDAEIRAWLAGTKTQFRLAMMPQPAPAEPIEVWRTDGHGLWYGAARLESTGGLGLPVTELIECPYGVIGDRFWSRETWCRAGDEAICEEDPQLTDGRPRGPIVEHLERPVWAYYRATDPDVVNVLDEDRSPWKSPILMPRWASRITFEITEVRVQRVQEITEADARAEGIVSGLIPADDYGPVRVGFVFGKDDGRCVLYPAPIEAYRKLWDSSNGKRRRRGDLIRLGESGYGRRQFRTVLDESARWEANPMVWCLSCRMVK